VNPKQAEKLNQQIRRIAQLLPHEEGHRYAFTCECGCGGTASSTAEEFDRNGGAWTNGHRPQQPEVA
jgi:hypothetical protein